MIHDVELLSPAGSWDALVAAVQNGANAVYMGGNRFNARRFADNFDEQKLVEAIQYAHLYGVRIYITVNTLIKEKEISDVARFLAFLCENKADGIIVQDIGIARFAHKNYPSLDLHASTQMSVHNLEGVRILEDLGFKRVVLARELTLDEISYIKEHSSIQLETFIHGALCICYSGQCLMSSILGGRSGNRGMCAQPCRLPYYLTGSNSSAKSPVLKHELSAKDIAAYGFLEDIIRAGVNSLKIEGRMKRAEYVAVVTREYRKLIDEILANNNPDLSVVDEKALLQIFNRGGFSKGYYYGTNCQSMMSKEKPGHWGVYLGKIESVHHNWASILLEEDIEIGDKVEFWTDKQKGIEQQISQIKENGREVKKASSGHRVQIRLKQTIPENTPVWRTVQERLLAEARNTYDSLYKRKIPITAKGIFKIGEQPVLEFFDPQGNTGSAAGQQIIEKAEKRALTKDQIENQLNKLGDTPFQLIHSELIVDDNIFMSISYINQLRRDCSESLIKNRLSSFEKKSVTCKSSDFYIEKLDKQVKKAAGGVPKLYLYSSELIDDPDILGMVDGICFHPYEWSMDIEEICNKVQNIKRNKIDTRLVLPRISRKEDLEFLNGLSPEIWKVFDSYQVGNLGQIIFLKGKKVKRIFGDFSLNIFNTLAIDQLNSLGLEGLVLSPELTYNEIRDIMERASLPCEVYFFGCIPLMITEYCPTASKHKDCKSCGLENNLALVDRKNLKFPLHRMKIARCYTEIWNSKTLLLADEYKKIRNLPIDRIGLRLEKQDIGLIKRIVKLHRYVLNNPGSDLSDDFQGLVDELKNLGFTRGHMFRGVE